MHLQQKCGMRKRFQTVPRNNICLHATAKAAAEPPPQTPGHLKSMKITLCRNSQLLPSIWKHRQMEANSTKPPADTRTSFGISQEPRELAAALCSASHRQENNSLFLPSGVRRRGGRGTAAASRPRRPSRSCFFFFKNRKTSKSPKFSTAKSYPVCAKTAKGTAIPPGS